jgi:deoxyribonuclease V
MVLALDVHYKPGNTAKSVGFLFNWDDLQPQQTIIEYSSDIEDYVPGEFYKRELPCLLKVIEKVDLSELEAIIIDGYIYVDNNGKYGLGGVLWETLNRQIPIIGIGKTSFFSNKETVVEIFRGESKNPLFVSVIGCNLQITAEKIKSMQGNYRNPSILQQLDGITKTE